MPPELVALLKDCDTLAKSVQGAVSSAARDIRKEVVYLAGELDIATSSDAREAVFAKIGKRLKKLRGRVDGLTSALNAKIADAAAVTVKEKCGDLVRIDAKHEKAIIEAVSGIGGANMAATMTGAMNQNIVTALRDATTAAFREQAVSGLTARELEEVIKSKWEAAAKDPKNLQFVDKAGKLWDTDTYVNMNVRTNAMRIYNETVIQDIANTTGSDLVMVSRGGDCNCRLCFPWEGRILSISGKTPGFPSYSDAIKAGLFHPNCVHTVEVVDEEWDADEIALQRQFPPPEGLKPKDMDDNRYKIDMARQMMENPGMDVMAARVAVDRVNLETSMRQGLITEKAQAIVDAMTDAQVEALCPNGNPPQFLPAKYNDGEDGYHPGKRGGVVYLHRTDPTLEKLLAATSVKEGVTPQPTDDDLEVQKAAKDATKKAEPKKPGPETDDQRLRRKRAELVAFMDGYFTRAGEFATDADRFNASAVEIQKAIADQRSGLISYAEAKGRDASWVMQNVPQEAEIGGLMSASDKLAEEVMRWRQTQGEDELAISDATASGVDAMDEATVDAVTKRIRGYNATLNRFRLELAKRFETLEKGREQTLARAQSLAAQGKAVVDALTKKEDDTADYTRPTAESLGIDVAAVKAMPIEEAIKATSKLNDGMDAVKLTFDKHQRQTNEWWTAEDKKVREKFSGLLAATSEARRIADYGKPSDGVHAITRVIAEHGLEKDFDKFLKAQYKKNTYYSLYTAGMQRRDDRTGQLRDMTQEEIDAHNCWIYRQFMAKKQTATATKQSKELSKLETERRSRLAEADILTQFGDAKGGCKITSAAIASRADKWAVAEKIMSKVMAADVCPSEKVNVVSTSGRAYQSGRNITLAGDDGVGVYIHEFCHFVEQYNPHVHDRCAEFLKMRAERSGTTQTQSLRKLTGGRYDADEMTLADDFFRPYCGKIYGRNEYGITITREGQTVGAKGAKFDVTATEILSMGVQRIYENPTDFYEKDREYFDFCLNLLQGNL